MLYNIKNPNLNLHFLKYTINAVTLKKEQEYLSEFVIIYLKKHNLSLLFPKYKINSVTLKKHRNISQNLLLSTSHSN